MIYPQKDRWETLIGVKNSGDIWCSTYAAVSARKKKEYIHIYVLHLPDYVYKFMCL